MLKFSDLESCVPLWLPFELPCWIWIFVLWAFFTALFLDVLVYWFYPKYIKNAVFGVRAKVENALRKQKHYVENGEAIDIRVFNEDFRKWKECKARITKLTRIHDNGNVDDLHIESLVDNQEFLWRETEDVKITIDGRSEATLAIVRSEQFALILLTYPQILMVESYPHNEFQDGSLRSDLEIELEINGLLEGKLEDTPKQLISYWKILYKTQTLPPHIANNRLGKTFNDVSSSEINMQRIKVMKKTNA